MNLIDNKGRFPANFIHDGSEEVLSLFPNVKSGGGDKHSKTQDGIIFKGIAPVSGLINYVADSGSAARFFYCAKASKSERNKGCEGLEEKTSSKFDGGNFNGASTNANNRTNQNNHPTVKPLSLMKYLVKLVTPKGGKVLDLFAGSGTTGVACKELGFDCILMEKEIEHIEIINARISDPIEKPKIDNKELLLYG